MGYAFVAVKLPPDYGEDDLKEAALGRLKLRQGRVHILGKNLDARSRRNIHWHLRLQVVSPELPGDDPEATPELSVPFRKRDERVLVVGSGPAGFFAAFLLQQAGFQVTLVERGADVARRSRRIKSFETTGRFDPLGTYAFGEGGAGTFSDGKLTARSKHISRERRYVLARYREAGAPEEIEYLAHPHLGSDNLRTIVVNLRNRFQEMGGFILFETMVEDLRLAGGRVTGVVTSAGVIDLDLCLVAPGNAAFDTFRMLLSRGVPFRTKPFALGSRVEHRQNIINRAQWGVESLPGVKAAEYRLASRGDGTRSVYTFCMCPGGTVVPATAFAHSNIVNGMSRFNRSEPFANAACVAAINPEELTGGDSSPEKILDRLEELEERFYQHAGGYGAPSCSIADFIAKRETGLILETSYPLGLRPAPLWELLPRQVEGALREGIREFSRKIRGFEEGIILGLESKTSSPLQAVRQEKGLSAGFENLYILGEGSGWSGGILSSAADGIKAALRVASGADR